MRPNVRYMKKKVMQDTTKNYYIDVWVLSQNLSYYRLNL